MRPDTKFFTGALRWVPLTSENYYVIQVNGVKVGSTDLNQCVLGCSAIVDSGTSLLVGPSQYVDQVISTIGTVNQDCSNWQSLPNVEFTINGQQYAITPVEYVLNVSHFGFWFLLWPTLPLFSRLPARAAFSALSPWTASRTGFWEM